MGKVISIINNKGGVGKTTTTMNFGAALVELGKHVLLIDMDSQCNLTDIMLPVSKRPEDAVTVFTSMLEEIPLAPVEVRQGLDIVPGDTRIFMSDVVFSDPKYADRSRTLLKERISGLRDIYDYIIIDCPPSRSLIHLNALVASDEVIVPVLPEILSVAGVKDINALIESVRENLNPGLKIAGFLLIKSGKRTVAARSTKVYIESAANLLGTRLFATGVRENVTVVESQMMNQDIFMLDRQANAAKDYLALAREYLESEVKQ